MRTADTIASSGATPANRPSISPSGPTSRSCANWTSKSRSSSSPFSKAISSSRASGSLLTRPNITCGSIPASTQCARNEANRSVVSTPPQSISSAERVPAPSPRVPELATARSGTGSATERHLLGARDQLEYALAEGREVGVVGGAGDRALVVALHEHHALPQRERRVPADVAHRAARALLVARDPLGARGEALPSRHAAELRAQTLVRVAGLGPHHAQVAEVGERVADRRHLPVEDTREAGGGAGGEDRVPESVVTVDDRRRPRAG